MKTVYATALLSMGLLFWLLLQPENPPESMTIRILIGGGTLFLFLFGVMVHHKPRITIIILNVLGISTAVLVFEYLLIYSIDINATVSVFTTVFVIMFVLSYSLHMIAKYVLN